VGCDWRHSFWKSPVRLHRKLGDGSDDQDDRDGRRYTWDYTHLLTPSVRWCRQGNEGNGERTRCNEPCYIVTTFKMFDGFDYHNSLLRNVRISRKSHKCGGAMGMLGDSEDKLRSKVEA
jgi:hypothetical protein